MENYIRLMIKYDNGDIQTWDYDGAQFSTITALKSNMTKDFKTPRLDRKSVIVYASGFGNLRAPFEIKLSDEKGSAFTKLVFAEIEKRAI